MGYDSLSFREALVGRRSIYALEKKSPISDARIKEIAKDAVLNSPSSFNSQSTRLVVLLKAEHDKFWDIVIDILKAQLPADKWESTGQKLNGFRGGYGTVSTVVGLPFADSTCIQPSRTAFRLHAIDSLL